MSISFVGTGTTATAAASVSPTYPSTPTVGQLGVLQVVSGTSTDSTPTTPSGWTLVDSFSGGGGSFGSGSGPRRLTLFVRVMAGGDAVPTVTVPSGTGSVVTATVTLLSRSGGTGWRWASAFAEDASSGTGFSAVAAAALTWAVGDFAYLGYALPLSTVTLSAQALAASGETYGTVTSRFTTAAATGNGARTAAATTSVSTGAGTAAPTVSATLSAANTGVAGVLRIRQATAALAATAQTVFPPRTLVAATGMKAEDIVEATFYRQQGTDLTAVRAASGIDVTGTDALLRVDAEMPFGVPVSYVAQLTDVNGLVWQVTSSGTITSTVPGDVISDAVNGIGATVELQAPLDKQRDRNATTFNVGGRMVAVSRRRSGASSTVTLRTLTDADGDALDQVLQGATEGVVMIRKQTSLSRLDGYFAVLSDNERPHWYDEVRWWDLTTIQAESWPDVLEAAGFTLADIAANFNTLADLSAAFPTLLAIALNDFGP